MAKDIVGDPRSYNETVSVNRGPMPSGVDPAQWDANPYANFDYRHTWMQRLWEGLGFRSKFDEYKENMALNAAEYDAQLAEKAHNEAYDSPLAQAQRQRAAGLNPDLNGNVDSGSSSPMEPDPNAPISSGSNDPSIFLNVASGLVGSVETLFGLVESGIGLAGVIQDVESKSLDNDKKYMENSLDAFLNASLATMPNQGERSDGYNYHWRFGYDKDSRLARLLGSSRRAKKYAKSVNLFRESLIGQEAEFEHRGGRAKNRSIFAGIKGRSTYSEVEDVIEAYEGAISDLVLDAELTGYQKQTAQNVYESEVTQALDPERMAEATMSGAENQAALSGAEAAKTGSEKKMIDVRMEAKNSLDSLSSHLEKLDGFPAVLGRILVDLLKVRVFNL